MPARQNKASDPRTTPETDGECRLLLLEDAAPDAELAWNEVRKTGLNLKWQVVAGWDEFIHSLAEYRPRIVLSDYSLAGFTALDALRHLRKHHPGVPLIVVSRGLAEQASLECIREGASDCVPKGNLALLAPAVARTAKMLEAEEELRRAALSSETAARAQFNSVPVPTYTWRWDGKEFIMTGYNEAAEAISRGKVASQIGNKAREFFRDDPEIVSELKKCFDLKTTLRRDMYYRLRSTGEWKYLSVSYGFVPPDLVMVHTEDITQRTLAEQSLRRSEELNRRILDSVPGGIVQVSESGGILTANTEARRILGLNFDEQLQLYIADFEHQTIWEDGSPCRVEDYPVSRCLKTGQPQPPATIGVRRKDGSVAWAIFTAIPLTNVMSGKPSGAVMTFLDITERKRAEEALRAGQARYRSLAESSQAGIWQIDAAGHTIYANKSMCGLLEIAGPEELSGHTFHEFFTPENLEILKVEHTKRLNGFSSTYAVELTGRKGTQRTVMISGGPIISPDGQFESMIGTFIDITELIRVEASLRAERDFSNTILQASPTFFVAIGADGRTIMMNNAMLQALGYSLEEVAGTPYLATFVPEDDRELLGKVFERLVAGSGPTVNENHVLARDGRTRLVEWHGRPVFKDGKFDYFFGVGIDITERRRAAQERAALERKLQETQKLESLGVLAGGIAHDFNNLLAAILGNVSLANMQSPQDSVLRPYLASIETTTHRAAELCKQMLAYAGKARFIVLQVQINSIISEMGDLLRISMGRHIHLRFNLGENLPAIVADATQIRQVVMNLIINGAEAIGEHEGTISVETGIASMDRASLRSAYLSPDIPEGRYLYLQVTDTGCGMDAETQAKIFDPFFTTKFTGRGLGLAAVLGIVRGHRGAIHMKSTPGQGTTFKVCLPVEGKAPVSSEEPA